MDCVGIDDSIAGLLDISKPNSKVYKINLSSIDHREDQEVHKVAFAKGFDPDLNINSFEVIGNFIVLSTSKIYGSEGAVYRAISLYLWTEAGATILCNSIADKISMRQQQQQKLVLTPALETPSFALFSDASTYQIFTIVNSSLKTAGVQPPLEHPKDLIIKPEDSILMAWNHLSQRLAVVLFDESAATRPITNVLYYKVI